jgi:hypothetical protein
VDFHKTQKLGNWDSPVPPAWDAVALELAGVEPFCYGTRSDLANLGDLAGGKYVFSLAVVHKDSFELNSVRFFDLKTLRFNIGLVFWG